MEQGRRHGMTGASDEETSLRAYLLGRLPPDEQLRIEERLLVNADLVELLQIIEEDLVDGYLGGKLSELERQEFQTHFLTTPHRHRKLRLARALKKYVNREPIVPPVAAAEAWWRRLWISPTWRPAIVTLL